MWAFETRHESLSPSRRPDAAAHRQRESTPAEGDSQGPPRSLFRSDMTDSEWKTYRDRAIWIRLAKFEHAGGKLTKVTESRYSRIKARLPGLSLAKTRATNSHSYFGGVTINRPTSIRVPHGLTELIEYLRSNPMNDRSNKTISLLFRSIVLQSQLKRLRL